MEGLVADAIWTDWVWGWGLPWASFLPELTLAPCLHRFLTNPFWDQREIHFIAQRNFKSIYDNMLHGDGDTIGIFEPNFLLPVSKINVFPQALYGGMKYWIGINQTSPSVCEALRIQSTWQAMRKSNGQVYEMEKYPRKHRSVLLPNAGVFQIGVSPTEIIHFSHKAFNSIRSLGWKREYNSE